ncbi:hypothetical protein [Hymenobacter cellulosivorans]|uniref:Leucine-rich repeat domain-containing protein n=1 Tax=Hymenobacter cellulosivorans TaxID=2932249 RepID=A0ABY4F7D2_9BACT|nr:hypothetical protein [Hymenobacter cellulosivorans]UOQ52582.1 hypothetical protein MUN80_22875 [Hymenobacter cellulosivorans]
MKTKHHCCRRIVILPDKYAKHSEKKMLSKSHATISRGSMNKYLILLLGASAWGCSADKQESYNQFNTTLTIAEALPTGYAFIAADHLMIGGSVQFKSIIPLLRNHKNLQGLIISDQQQLDFKNDLQYIRDSTTIKDIAINECTVSDFKFLYSINGLNKVSLERNQFTRVPLTFFENAKLKEFEIIEDSSFTFYQDIPINRHLEVMSLTRYSDSTLNPNLYKFKNLKVLSLQWSNYSYPDKRVRKLTKLENFGMFETPILKNRDRMKELESYLPATCYLMEFRPPM